MTLTRREKIMIIVGLTVVTLAAYIFYFIVPYMQKTQDAVMNYAQADSRVKVLKMKQAQLDKLSTDIKALEEQLNTQGSALPHGIDHARILAYLKDLTDGKAEELNISVPSQAAVSGNFIVQSVTLDFRATYDEYVQILETLKQNKLYGRVTFDQATYAPFVEEAPPPAATPAEGGEQTVAPAATPAPTPDDNVLKVHIEMNFFALQPEADAPSAPVMPPTNGDRTGGLFPIK